jgi:drug/metabolite transporter (DMT)-like permease
MDSTPLPSTLLPDSAAHRSKGYLICIAGTLAWSTTGVLIRYLTNFGLPPLVLAFWRDLFVAFGLAVGLAAARPALLRPARGQLGFLVWYGLILAVFNTTWTFSVTYNGAAVATVLAYSSPALTTLLSWRIFGERLGAWKLGAIALSLAGCVLVSGAHDPAAWVLNGTGILLGLLSGLMFAFYSLMGTETARRGLNSWSTLLYAFGLAAVFLLVGNVFLAPPTHLLWLGSAWQGWAWLFALAVGPTIGGFGLYTYSLSYLPAGVANLIASMEPALTAAIAYLFLGEQMTSVQWLGSGLILVSVLSLRWRN